MSIAGATNRRPDPTAGLRVAVLASDGSAIDGVNVAFRPASLGLSDLPINLRHVHGLGYVADGVPWGVGTLTAHRPGFQPQERAVRVESNLQHEVVVLARDGQTTYRCGEDRAPVDAGADLVGIQFESATPAAIREAEALAEGHLGLTPIKVTSLARVHGLRLYRAPSGDGSQAIAQLSELKSIRHVGAAIQWRESSFTFLSKDVVVRVRAPSAHSAAALAESFGYDQTREVRYSPATFVWRWKSPATRALLANIDRVADSDRVVWVEPNLIAAPELNAVVPGDALWPGLWDRQLLGLPDAWQALKSQGKEAFGSPEVVLAIWDTGVKSLNGVPLNEDLGGMLSNGAPKIAVSYDFKEMRADNDMAWSPHGSAVTSLASASANNPASGSGAAFGLVGVAPNVSIMTICADPTSELLAADQFVWMTGFHPGGAYPNPPARGADIISCSLTLGRGNPNSPIAKAALDYVTTFGRGGKGTLCFFAAGNLPANTGWAMPWAAYAKSFGIAASLFDGAVETHAPYSGFARIEICAPAGDGSQTNLLHDPPTKVMTWAAWYPEEAALPSYAKTATTLSNAVAAGSSRLDLESRNDIEVGNVLHIGDFGAPGSEPARVAKLPFWSFSKWVDVDAFDGASFSGTLLHDHPAGAVVAAGPANHCNNFWGTSSAAPLAAGVAALVLSAAPSLTWVQVRSVLRRSAKKIDAMSNDPTGRWLDEDGNPATTSGKDPVFSGWFGHGRVDASAAVRLAQTIVDGSDLVIRDNLADAGDIASVGDFANTPDVWCRRAPPESDAGAMPPDYATPGPHQDPLRGQSNWIYVRVRNRGSQASLDAWARVSVSNFPGLEFTYPASFVPSNGPGALVSLPMSPGTYFVGEAKLTEIPGGGEQIVAIEWTTDLIPPANLVTPAGLVDWHPCLLAEITPHDGPSPTGNHVWDDNNLAQKNVSIVDVASGAEFQTIFVMGEQGNGADSLLLDVVRGLLPPQVQLYLDVIDGEHDRRIEASPGDGGWRHGELRSRRVILLAAMARVSVPIPRQGSRLTTVVLGGLVPAGCTPGVYDIGLVQRQRDGRRSGMASITAMIR